MYSPIALDNDFHDIVRFIQQLHPGATAEQVLAELDETDQRSLREARAELDHAKRVGTVGVTMSNVFYRYHMAGKNACFHVLLSLGWEHDRADAATDASPYDSNRN